MITAKIVADSIGPNGKRLTTFVLTYPRFIHSEFMTHRKLSRNASSSRAIPVMRQIRMVLRNPAMPLAFAANKAGMQAGDNFGPFKQLLCRAIWRGACYAAVGFAVLMEKMNIHKQYANRILEPFSHITVVATATDWDNFFALRIHPAAQPEIHELARLMYGSYQSSVPEKLKAGMWHLPFVDQQAMDEIKNRFDVSCLQDKDGVGIEMAIKRSVARCARVSYLNHDGTAATIEKDLELYVRLLGGVPIHASPAEHQGMASDDPDLDSGNFTGWLQYRKTLPNENIEKYVPHKS